MRRLAINKRKKVNNVARLFFPKNNIEMVETIVYTDGACSNNQGKQEFRRAGWGVWYGKDDKRNISDRLVGLQTNNRAELTAILAVFQEYKKEYGQLIIYTDSNYCLGTLNKWMYDAKKRGWKTSAKKPLKNIELIKALYYWMEKIDPKPIIRKVKAHSISLGNNEADHLATQACIKVKGVDRLQLQSLILEKEKAI